MGEFAIYRGERIKIGTCEDLYYLRADQQHLVGGYPFHEGVVRFRFPFPDEDTIEPGCFDQHDRGVKIPDFKLSPAEFQGHYSVQFTARPGYVLSIPCPEQFGQHGMEALFGDLVVEGNGEGVHYPVRVGRNGWNGDPVVKQQVVHGTEDGGSVLATVIGCGACGAAWRLPTLADAQPVIDAFRAEAAAEDWRRLSSDWDEEKGCWGDTCNYGFESRHTESTRAFLRGIADRIEAGYSVNWSGVNRWRREQVS